MMVSSKWNSTFIPKATECELIYLPATEKEQKEYAKMELLNHLFSPPKLTYWPLMPLPFYKQQDFVPSVIQSWINSISPIYTTVSGLQTSSAKGVTANYSQGQLFSQGPQTVTGTLTNIIFLEKVIVGKGNSKQRLISIHYFRHLHLKLCHATLVRLRLPFQGYFKVQVATEVNMLAPFPTHSLLLILACIFLHSLATAMPEGCGVSGSRNCWELIKTPPDTYISAWPDACTGQIHSLAAQTSAVAQQKQKNRVSHPTTVWKHISRSTEAFFTHFALLLYLIFNKCIYIYTDLKIEICIWYTAISFLF